MHSGSDRRDGRDISIHALRGEGDGITVCDKWKTFEFQSTPSVGRATRLQALQGTSRRFQSTPSVGRATSATRNAVRIKIRISIHALRGEGDPDSRTPTTPKGDFNPRPPWGGRLKTLRQCVTEGKFQSTPSVGRATKKLKKSLDKLAISIHALRGEGDKTYATGQRIPAYFNPRPPWGGRRVSCSHKMFCKSISIHALRGEGDQKRRRQEF